MGLYKRNSSQFSWMSFRINGRRIFESTETTNKKLAEKIYAKRLTEITEGKWFFNEARKRTFEELRDKYMTEHSKINKTPTTQVRDGSAFKRLSGFFGGLMLLEITPAQISDYKSLRIKAGIKPSTISRELEVLRHAMNLALQWEWIETSPFSKIKLDRPKNEIERWITAEEEKRLLDASTHQLREIIIFALNTGMRQDEILSLQWSQVDLFRRNVTLLITKNKEKRTIPINQTVLDLLKFKSKVRHLSGYVFISQAGIKIIASNLLRAYYVARKKAGLEDVRFHDLRHTFATRLVQAGVDLYTVAKILGHKDIRMTQRYAHHNTESLRHGVDILDRSGDILVTFIEKQIAANAATP
ncbi:MAG: tyrosine-type recombinase/integrase [Nitrospira sp.]|nr:tyrosine-type recombinase/integrase [Nitrospira sp.]